MNYTPVIIIGAGRSGTNMLRDIITSIPDFETWDCDEINPIWRYGNKDFETDELLPEHASDRIKKYIRGRFKRLHNKSGAGFIIEKTCANSLRLAYIYEIFPDAKYIIINRDGRDVVPSAMKRWVSSFDFMYTLKKLRYVPLTDLLHYICKFGINRIKKSIFKKEILSFWGPVYQGIEKDKAQLPLMDLCANQWSKCANQTLRDRKNIPEKMLFDIKYETFVSNPSEEMERLSKFLNIELEKEEIYDLVKNVSLKSVGSHKKKFSEEQQNHLNEILSKTLKNLNYN